MAGVRISRIRGRRPPVRVYTWCCFGVALLFALFGNVLQLRSLPYSDNHNAMMHHLLNQYYATTGIRRTQSLESQDVSFRQVLKRTTFSQQLCNDISNNNSTVPVPPNNSTQSRKLVQQQHSVSLPRFGMAKAVSEFLSESNKGEEECLLPPTTACDVTDYSLQVTFGEEPSNNDLRILFVNLLMFLTYPNVKDIVVVLFMDVNVVKQDSKYGQRLLAWHLDQDHKIKLVFAQDRKLPLWDTITPKLFPSNAILWMNGNELWQGNQRGLQTGFELWKRQSQSLVSFRGYRVQADGATNKSSTALQEKISFEHDTEGQATNSSSVNFVPTCPEWKLTLEDGYDYNTFQLVDMSGGLFIHRNLLCFLSSGIFDELRHYLVASQRDNNILLEKVAMGIALSQISGKLPRPYPYAVKAGKRKESKKTTPRLTGRSRRTSAIEESSSLLNVTTNKGIVNTTAAKHHDTHDVLQQSSGETEVPNNRTKGVRWENTGVGLGKDRPRTSSQRRVVPSKKKEPVSKARETPTMPPQPLSLDTNILTELVGYFGNIPPGSIGWCSNCNEQDDVVYLGDVPWMNWGGQGNARCYSWSDKLF